MDSSERLGSEVTPRLLESVEKGFSLVCSPLAPEELASSDDPRHIIRAGVIRDILLGRLVDHPDPGGLRVTGARIVDALDLDHVSCGIGLELRGCWLNDPMRCSGTKLPWLTLAGSHLPAFGADHLQVDGSVDLSDAHVSGAIMLYCAHIGGSLGCNRTHLANEKGPAIVGDSMQVDNAMLLRQARVTGNTELGTVRLAGAHIARDLECDEAELTNTSGPALYAEALQVDGTVNLSKAHFTGSGGIGAVRLLGTHIGVSLNCNGAQLTNTSGPALHADRMHVEGSVFLGGFQATGNAESGAVRLLGARIASDLDCAEAHVANEKGPAIVADGLQVDGSMYLRDGFRATGHGELGTVRLRSTSVGWFLDFRRGRICNPDGLALDLRSASVKVLRLPADVPCRSCTGQPETWVADGQLLLAGLSYTNLDPEGATLDEWLYLLRHQTSGYAAQPYQQLAAVQRAAGHDADARRILIAQQDDLQARGQLGGSWARSWHRLLGVMIGYGYQTWRALLGLAVVVVLAVGLGLTAGHVRAGPKLYVAAHAKMTAQPGTACSTLEQVGLGIDRGLPLINTGIRDRCDLDTVSRTGQIITALAWILQIAAWALATLVIAGYTGLVRKI
jgi:hypothetical protein